MKNMSVHGSYDNASSGSVPRVIRIRVDLRGAWLTSSKLNKTTLSQNKQRDSDCT